MTTPFRTLPKSKYPGLPLTYITAIAEKKGLTLEVALLIIADCGDVDRAWGGDDNDKQDYLDDVDRALSRHLDQQRPEFKKRNNTWAENDHMLQRVLRSSRMRLYGLFPESEVDAKLCEIWKVLTLNDLHLLKGSDDKAIKTIEQWKAGFMANVKPKDGTNQPSLMDEKPKINLVALGVKIGEVFAKYDMEYNGTNYRAATGDIGAPGSIDNGKSEATILAQVEGWCMEQKQAKKTEEKKPEPALGNEIDLDLSEGAAKLQALMDAEKKTEDAPSANGEAAPLDDAPATKPDDQPKATAPASDPIPAKADEPEAIEATVVEENLDMDGEEDIDGREYTYAAHWTDASKRWFVNLTTYVKIAPEEIPEIEKRTTGYLQLSRQSPVEFSWHHLAEPPVDKITEARKSADVLIKNAWKEWDNEESINLRVDKLREILGVTAMPVALATYGYKGTLKRVQDATLAKIKADDEEQRKRHEEESKRFEERALTTTQPSQMMARDAALMLTSFNSPIKVPTDAEGRIMNQMASFAVQCGIYPTVAAANLAIYTGFEMGFGISASIRLIYAFVGKHGKTNVFPSAAAYAAKCLSVPAICERFVITNDTDESATVLYKRRGGEQQTFRYTKEDALQAGLWDNDKKPAWKENPKAMMRNRAAWSVATTAFGDLCSGLSDPDLDTDEFQLASGF